MSCLYYCCLKPDIVECKKKVTFDNKVTVLYFENTPMEVNVNWQQVARDRVRFNRRVLDVERRIGWVLASSHRERVLCIL